MKVFTQSVNFNADSDLLDFVQQKVEGLEKFHTRIIDAEVFLKVQQTSEKENKITEVKINIPNHNNKRRKNVGTNYYKCKWLSEFLFCCIKINVIIRQ